VITECSVEDDIQTKMLIMCLMCGTFVKLTLKSCFKLSTSFDKLENTITIGLRT
jgi:hypothetical protein